MKRHFTSWAWSLLALCSLSVLSLAQAPSRFVVFGDSLSDSGNFYAEMGQVVLPPFVPIPDAPYAMGGHHFSNGATWVERMATWMRANPSAKPAMVNPGVFSNYAFGRARARPNATTFAPYDFGTQVELFLDDFDDLAPDDATYLVWIGTNDARDAFVAGGDPVVIGESLAAIGANLMLLLQHGARDFVVLNVPDLGLVPAINGMPDPIPAQATGFSLIYNAQLSSVLDTLEPLIVASGGTLVRVDAFLILQSLVADPLAAGLTNVTDPCLSFGVRGGFMPPHPNGYLFWDGIHPSRAGHAALGSAVMEVLSAP